MRQCLYCTRWFKNKQSVRAHLKYCEKYHETLDEDGYLHEDEEEYVEDDYYEDDYDEKYNDDYWD